MKRLILLVCLLAPTTFAAEPEWPQWRGPDRTDISRETGLLKSWPKDGPRRVWLFRDAGVGYSGPAIAGGRLFTMGARDGQEQLFALDVKSGKELWKIDLGSVLDNRWGDGPRSTPTVDGERVYALSGRGDLVCGKTADGSPVWQRNMNDFGVRIPGWGYCESVLIDGNQLVCTPGGKDGAIVALNKSNGELLWQSSEFTDGAQYASIIAADHNGQRQYIQLTMRHVVGIAAKDGKLLWQADFPGRTAVIPTPIFHNGHVYVTSGYNAGCKLLKIGPDNKLEELYSNKTMKNHHGGVLLLGNHIYGYSDGAGWMCQDLLTGEKVWSERRALGKGSLTYADGMLYCISERDGTVALAEASPKGWEQKGRFVLEPQTELRKPAGRIWTHPVVVNGKLFLRDQDLIYCYDVKQP